MYQTNKNLGEEVLIPDAKVKDFGIFTTTHYHLKKVDIQAGIRFDSRKLDSEQVGLDSDEEDYIAPINRSFTSFNAALGAKIDLNEAITLRLNLASGFRAPNLAELTSNGVHEGTNRYEIGNQDLGNEQNLQTDISFELNSEHFELFVNGFYNLINDYIYVSPTGEIIESTFVYEYLQNDARLYGGEIGLHLHPHPIDWLHFESNFESVTGKNTTGDYLPLIPANSIQNTIRIEFQNTNLLKDSNTFISLKSTFNQYNVYEFETNTKGYSLLSLGGSTSIEFEKFMLRMTLNITNLTDENYISHLSRLKPDGIANMGRSFNLGIKVEI
jgi:iron complex outermembrane receptor protein